MGGGFGGGGGFHSGIHGVHGPHGLHVPGERRANRSDIAISTYAAVEMTSTTDATLVPALTTKLTESLPAFNGRLVSHDTSPSAIDGVPPTTFFLVAFNTTQEADGWRVSQPFKNFETDAQKAGVRIFTVNALPVMQQPEPHSASRDEEERSYQKLINGGNQTLKKIQDICRGC
ncbi:hypothetical protein SAMN05443249_0974 [Beijerinckia sp. 28-YEA-48]|nr:hypothetical protein SAMN05443249_0974 [Beijerinckia sp. 28-YEA-48]